MFKLRSFLIAVALVALLSATNWQASFASVGEGQLNLQSKASVATNLICINHFVPNADQSACICPEDFKLDFFGNCKEIKETVKERHEDSCVTKGDCCNGKSDRLVCD